MKQKLWIDCPSCGARGSMFLRKAAYERFSIKNYPKIKIGPLTEYTCKKCKDGIYTLESQRYIEFKIAEHKAMHDAKTTVVSEVLPVSEASHFLKMTRQGVQNLMRNGKLEYVFFGKRRVPKRCAVLKYAG